jgi:hypothetical protein
MSGCLTSTGSWSDDTDTCGNRGSPLHRDIKSMLVLPQCAQRLSVAASRGVQEEQGFSTWLFLSQSLQPFVSHLQFARLLNQAASHKAARCTWTAGSMASR